MARLPRLCLPGTPQHIIQRGNNRQVCFTSNKDFSAYAYWLEEYSRKYEVAIHAWVFMTNHSHLLVTPSTMDGISKMMQSLGRRYVQYFNHTYKRTGTLWEGRFKSCVIDAENYLLSCQRYIELNPVRANMVLHPAEYAWSSYSANGLGRKAKLYTPHESYIRLGKTITQRTRAYRQLFRYQLDEGLLNEIRMASNKGMALGNDRFKKQVEKLTGRRVTEMKRGPKPEATE
jgi:putative transposase